jgi:hypothetical protein
MTMQEASNDSTSPERLSRLALSSQVPVRRRVAMNPSTPLSVLLELALSEDLLTCRNVYHNESSTEIIKTACLINKGSAALNYEY